MVGIVGFIVDSATLTVLVSIFQASPYVIRVCSYVAAASTTWALNRIITFRRVRGKVKKTQEWLRFLSANAPGALLNYLVFAVTVYLFQLKTQRLWIAVGMGSLSGLFLNFNLTKAFVFKEREKP
ncbi:GtrA family protein [Acididesulfobacillus acetoxydans]